MMTNILELSCIIDDFSIQFDRVVVENAIEQGGKKRRNRKSRLSDSEVMTILILFHMSRYRDLKSFYLKYVQVHLKSECPQKVSYNRFVKLQTNVGLKLVIFLNMCYLVKCTGVSIIDSTSLRSCHIKRERNHKNMKGCAQKGRSTVSEVCGLIL